jgi:hypothetical protein
MRSEKRFLISLFIMGCLGAAGLSAQTYSLDLTPLENDLNRLSTGIGRDLLPGYGRSAYLGSFQSGDAEISGKSGFYLVVLPSLGAQTTDGVGKVLVDQNGWQFALLPLGSLLGSVDNPVVDILTTECFPLTAIDVGFGFRLPGGFEIRAAGSYLPLSDALNLMNGVLPADFVNTISSLGLSAGNLSLTAEARKVICSERQNKSLPAFSVGLGYSYQRMAFGVSNFSLSELGFDSLSVGPLGTLDMTGSYDFNLQANVIDLNVNLSKTLGGSFRPFVRADAYYRIVSFTSELDASASVSPTDGSTPITQDLSASVNLAENDLAFSVAGGFELVVLKVFIVNFTAIMDLDAPRLDGLGSTNFAISGVGASLTTRLEL